MKMSAKETVRKVRYWRRGCKIGGDKAEGTEGREREKPEEKGNQGGDRNE